MPRLGTLEALRDHIRSALAEKDRWLLFGIGDRAKLVLAALGNGFALRGYDRAQIAYTRVDYKDVLNRTRFRGVLVSLPRTWATVAQLALVLDQGGYDLPADADAHRAILFDGTSDDLRGMQVFLACCEQDRFVPAPGTN